MTKRPDFEYAPFRKYHTQRVKRLRGDTLFQRLKFLYEHDAGFRLNTDLLCVISFSLFAAISIVTLFTVDRMSRIMQEPQQHIHDKLVSELNEMSIRIKLHYIVDGATRKKLVDDGKMPQEPTMEEINELLEQCRDEMNQCTQPFKHR